MAYKIAFYDTKPYDEHSFTEAMRSLALISGITKAI